MKHSPTTQPWRDDLAFVEFQSQRATLLATADSMNESDTRLRVIDTLLFDILRWEKTEVETEKYHRATGYSDYLFSIDGSRCLILEAKRAGVYFVLPNREFTDSPYAFSLLARECPEAMEALRQAASYALAEGCRYVGISNGHQWLFALTFVPDQPLSERQVYVFESVGAIESRFHLFWDCFGKAGIQGNSACDALLESRRVPAPPKFSAKIAGYPHPASRNVFANEVSYILDLVWDTIAQAENSEDFVNKCYVSPEAHGEIIDLATELFDKRRKEDEILLEYEVSSIDALPHQLASLPSERPFVILGEVGRGKSSFLKFLRFVAAREHLARYIQIDLNFVDRPDRTEQVPDFIYQEVARQLHEKYEVDIYSDAFARGVLNLDLIRLRTTPKGKLLHDQPAQYKEFEVAFIESAQKDTHVYLTKVMHHLKKGRNCSVAVFFDNLDRRDEVIQEAAFLKSSSIARDWSALVFVCLRPSTFYKSQERGVLDAIAPRTFTVGHPDLALVLKKRFAYATSIALGQKAIGAPASKNIAFHLPSVALIFDSCEFAARRRHGIIPMLEAVSNGNIRRLLDFAKMILSSRHLDTKKILKIIEDDGSYTIPDYEGVKALLYGDYMHYDPSKSAFVNLFELYHADPKEHFLRYVLLHYMTRFSTDGVGRGYTHVEGIHQYLALFGYTRPDIDDALEYLYDKKCLRGRIDGLEWSKRPKDLRVTSLGRYHVNILANTFQYIDAVVFDTPILDTALRDSLTGDFDIRLRVERTEQMLDYLDRSALSIGNAEILDEWHRASETVRGQIEEIRNRIK